MDQTRKVTGLDKPSTRTYWNGMPNQPAWHLVNARGWRFTDHVFDAANALLAAVVLESQPANGGVISTNNRFNNCTVNGYGRTRYGFVHGLYSSPNVVYPEYDANNEHHVYDQCSVYDTTDAAWCNFGHQAKEQSWRDCHAGSAYGGAGLRMWGGSGVWSGGSMYGFDKAFDLGSPSDPVTVIGGGYETIKQFLVCQGPRQDAYEVKLIGVRVMTDRCDATGDVPMIDFAGPGPLTIVGGQFGNGRQPLPVIQLRSWQHAPCVLNMIGVTFAAFGSWERRADIVRYVGDGVPIINRIGCIYADENGYARTEGWDK